MKVNLLKNFTDARQFKGWGEYLTRIGWNVEPVGSSHIFIRKLPFLNCSMIKFQRPANPIDFVKVEKLAKKYRALCVVIEPQIEGYKSSQFTKRDYRISKMIFGNTATALIDLTQSEDKLLSSFSQGARRNIRKAESNNLIVKFVDLKKEILEDHLKVLFPLFKSVTKKRKFYMPGFDEILKKMDSLKDVSFIFYAFENKESRDPIAALWLIHNSKTAIYLHPGITDRGYELLANYMLVWEAFKLLKKKKIKVFDFESVFDPRYPYMRRDWVNFSEFKSRFHGEVIEYPPSWIKFYNTIFKFSYFASTFMEKH